MADRKTARLIEFEESYLFGFEDALQFFDFQANIKY